MGKSLNLFLVFLNPILDLTPSKVPINHTLPCSHPLKLIKVSFDEYILYVFSDFCHNLLVLWTYLPNFVG